MSIREIARRFHHSRRTIRRVLHGDGQPTDYPKRQAQSAPKLGPFHEWILQTLADDESQPPKQRHTAMRLFERLRDEHAYPGGYDAVRRFVKKHRTDRRETFIPLDHEAGQRQEADFGKMYVDFPAGRQLVSVLILAWSYSNAPFAVGLPTERTEAILEGMVQAFEFFGRVPREVWWDNPKTVAAQILTGRDRKANPQYAALASHYVFEPLFCMPASGNEKPVVENRVKTMQRRWGTPVPCVKDFAELNEYLRECCLKDQARSTGNLKQTIGQRLEQDLRNGAPLPKHRFDACIRRSVKTDKYQFARFDNVSYSVPRTATFQTVTVKGYVDRVEIVCDDQVVATHERSYESGDQVLDPRHYLVTLTRRPAALDHSDVYRQWKLPATFDELRTRLEDRHGARGGVRQFVRVLQLLAKHSVTEVSKAIEQLRGPEGADADRLIRRVQATSGSKEGSSSENLDGLLPEEVTEVAVPLPSLTHFDSFLTQGLSHGETGRLDVTESESQTASATDHGSRVRPTGPGSDRLERDLPTVPASTNGTGSGHSTNQCPDSKNPPSQLPCGERPGELRLLGLPSPEQTESSRTGQGPMDCPAVERLPTGPTGNGQNASGGCLGELGSPERLQSSFLYGSGPCESTRREAEELSARPILESIGPDRLADL
jgi:transposase